MVPLSEEDSMHCNSESSEIRKVKTGRNMSLICPPFIDYFVVVGNIVDSFLLIASPVSEADFV